MPDHILIFHDSAEHRQGLIPWEVGFLRSSEEKGLSKVFRQAISKTQSETKDPKVAKAHKQAGGCRKQPLNEENFWSANEWQLISWQQINV